jgi:hypothetical protein
MVPPASKGVQKNSKDSHPPHFSKQTSTKARHIENCRKISKFKKTQNFNKRNRVKFETELAERPAKLSYIPRT